MFLLWNRVNLSPYSFDYAIKKIFADLFISLWYKENICGFIVKHKVMSGYIFPF